MFCRWVPYLDDRYLTLLHFADLLNHTLRLHISVVHHPHLKPAASLPASIKNHPNETLIAISPHIPSRVPINTIACLPKSTLLIIHYYSQSIFHVNSGPTSFVRDPPQGLLPSQPCKSDPSISTCGSTVKLSKWSVLLWLLQPCKTQGFWQLSDTIFPVVFRLCTGI